jgi:hypothetical protein
VRYPVTIILGKRQYGKTTWAVRHALHHPRVVVIDPKSVEPGSRIHRYEEPYAVPGAVFFSGPLAPLADELADLMNRRIWTIVFRSGTPYIEVVRLVREVGDCHFHFDELNRYLEEPELQRELLILLAESSAKGISFSCCAHRPQRLTTNIREAADKLIIFRTTGPRAQDVLRDFDADIDLDQVANLKVGEWIEVEL